MKRASLLLLAALGFAATDSTAAPVPLQRAAPRVQPNVSAITVRMNGKTVVNNGQRIPAAQYFGARATAITLRSGQKTTVGDLLDSYGRLDSEMKKHGPGIEAMPPKTRWNENGPPMEMQASNAVVAGLVARSNTIGSANPKGAGITYPAGDPNRAQQLSHDEESSWKIVAPYNHLRVSGADPATQDKVDCEMTWNAGVKVLTRAMDVVKVTGGVGVGKTGAPALNLTVYFMGKSEYVGVTGADDEPPFEKAVSTSQLPGGDPTTTFSVIKDVVTVNASAGGSAYVRIDSRGDAGSVRSGSNDVGFYCRATLLPTFRSEAFFRAEGAVGPMVLGMPLLTIAAKSMLIPLEFDMPTTVTLALHDAKVGFGFASNLHFKYMSGKLGLDWQLPDFCPGGNCVVADGLGINTSGEIYSWQNPSPPTYDGVLAKIDPGLGSETLVAR